MTYKLFGNEANDFMSLVTRNNYTMIELYYQLLNDLDSGNEYRALQIVFEIADAKYVKYAFKLLKRYAAREIGSSDPIAFILVKSLSEAWEKDKAAKAHGGEADRHYLALAVQYLARATKQSDTKDLTFKVNRDRCSGIYFEFDEVTNKQVEAYRVRELKEATNENK
ncbi:TPA: hypothetical protein DEW05_02565 [Candidatus Saccharibacteria bacterium]|nr:hypothetical protein [Candidatus Saccharibacteria bacterium]